MRLPVKDTTARSTRTDHPLGNLLDNDPFSFYHSSDNTDKRKYPWVQIELQTEAYLYHVQITNRLDKCCWKRLSNIEVRSGNYKVPGGYGEKIRKNQNCGWYRNTATADKIVVTIDCQEPVFGRYVTIQILDESVDILNIADVDIIGKKTNPSDST